MLEKKKLFIIALAALLFLSGCSAKKSSLIKQPLGNNIQTEKPIQKTAEASSLVEAIASQGKIHKFGSPDDVRDFLEENQINAGRIADGGNLKIMDEMGVGSTEGMAPTAQNAPASKEAAQNNGSSDYSATNVQTEGVDEADIIKTDGKYIYALVKNSLFIIDAFPASDLSILSKIEFESRPQDIYINGKNVVVFGYDNEVYQKKATSNFIRRNSYTFVKVFDVSDPKEPKQIRDIDLEGSYSDSRMIGDYVYFITTNYNYYYNDEEPVLPRVFENGEILSTTCAANTKCFLPDMYYFDIPYDSYNFTSITAVNAVNSNESLKGDVYLLSGSQNIYASLSNMYITYTKYISEYDLEMEMTKELLMPRLSEKDKNKIIQIDAAENFILSKNEKINKINQIIQKHIANLTAEEQTALEKELEIEMRKKYADISKELEKTIIHKIAIDKGNLEYKTYGEVVGHVLNQFSMDEADGFFRIATTKNRTWSRFAEEQIQSYNNMYVLDKDLKVVGSLEGLAENERIYSVRFMQARAYMVTFKQTDPLFVIDLSLPSNPKVLGELKIPGFSNYLHPYDENTLIGIGKDTVENEWGGATAKGIKISLFDVSDVSNPKEADTYILGDSSSDSIALNDHKAFLFSKEKNLMVIPVSVRNSIDISGRGNVAFSGAAVFNIDGKSIELAGKIDHNEGSVSSSPDYWRGYNYYDNTVKRSLYIDDALYTFSNNYLKVNAIGDLSLIDKLELKKEKAKDDFEVIN